jgi:mRNA interferase YafQ
MRTIERSTRFKRDYKREFKSRPATFDAAFRQILDALVNDTPLQPRHRDHDLSGNWAGYRDCHIWPDLVLIYRKSGTDSLQLVRLGSHSELFS